MRDILQGVIVATIATLVFLAPARAEIGSVAAVNRDMQGTPPGQAQRVLELGVNVFQDERIRTSEQGSGQLMFLDQTTLSVAPRTDIVLDSYVYDPATSTGEVALTLTRGALRLIGGRITKSRDAIVRTPTATIGVRGGMCIVRVSESGLTSVIQIAGERTIVTGLDGTTVKLSRSGASAEVTEQGEASFAGLVGSDELAPILSEFEGSGEGGSNAGGDQEAIDSGTSDVAAVNSAEEGGADKQPVSTSGEKPVETAEEDKDPLSSDPSVFGVANTDVTGGTGSGGTGSGGSALVVPTGGAFISSLSGAVTFASVSQGSLIGTTADGQVLRLPIPETSSEFATSLFGTPIPDFAALSLYPDTGFGTFTPTDAGSVPGFGPVEGIGFSDLGVGFHFYAINEVDGATPNEALVVFGTPTPGQAADFPTLGAALSSTVNTASVYRIEPDVDLDRPNDGGGEPLFMIANGDEPRFTDATGRASNGGKLLAGSIRIDDFGAAGQASDLSIYAASIGTNGTGPQPQGQIFGTERAGSDFFIRSENITAVEDRNGNTVFGPDGRYIVVISPVIPAGSGFELDAGDVHVLGGDLPSAPSSFIETDPITTLLTLDPSGNQIVNDPLSLAQHGGSRLKGAAGEDSASMDAVHAAGFGFCSNVDCGQNVSFTRSGFYALRSGFALDDAGEFRFENSRSGTDTNQLAPTFDLEGVATEMNFQAGGNQIKFNIAGTGVSSSAYLDDHRFGLNAAVATDAGGESTSADLIIGSSGLAGDGGIFAGQNPNGFPEQPVNARWGWWSASYDVTSGDGSLREDIVHMGTWVSGVRPDPASIPSAGIVGYGGIAVGTEVDLFSAASRVVGGDFELSYNFGTSSGAFRMNIAGLSINETAIGDPTNSHAYQVNATSPVSVNVNGTFFSGASDPVAATGGDFLIDDFAGNRQITGIFAGDQR